MPDLPGRELARELIGKSRAEGRADLARSGDRDGRARRPRRRRRPADRSAVDARTDVLFRLRRLRDGAAMKVRVDYASCNSCGLRPESAIRPMLLVTD